MRHSRLEWVFSIKSTLFTRNIPLPFETREDWQKLLPLANSCKSWCFCHPPTSRFPLASPNDKALTGAHSQSRPPALRGALMVHRSHLHVGSPRKGSERILHQNGAGLKEENIKSCVQEWGPQVGPGGVAVDALSGNRTRAEMNKTYVRSAPVTDLADV